MSNGGWGPQRLRLIDTTEWSSIQRHGARCALAGLVFGCCFPIAACILEVLLQHRAFSISSVLHVLNANPLYNFLNSVPLVSGLIGFVGGSNQARLIQHKADLERVVAERAAALEQTHAAHEQVRLHQEFLRSVLDTDPNFVFVKDPDGRFLLVNKAFADAYNTTVEDMVGKSDVDFHLDEESVAAYLEADRRMIASGQQVFIAEEVFAAAKGHTQWVQTVKRPIRVPGSDAIHVLGIATDITERKQTEAAVRKSEARLEEAQRISRVGSWELEIATKKIRWSLEMFRQFGIDPLQGEPDQATVLSAYDPEDEIRLAECRARAIADKVDYELDLRIPGAGDDGTRWYRAIGRPVLDENGEVVRIVGTQLDITERRRAEEQLLEANNRLTVGTALLQQHIERINEQTGQLEQQKAELQQMNARLETLATTDGLTGLKNHRTFQERLREEVESSNRSGSAVSVLMIDVDEFKIFNDTYGHPAGDAVLRTVAEVLQESVGDADLAARYGGEEFAVILPNTDETSAKSAAETLRSAIEAVSWSVAKVTASIGVATWTTIDSDAAGLVKQADLALYRSKQNGRNRVTHFVEAVAYIAVNEDKLKPYAQMVRQSLDLYDDTLVGASSSIGDQIIHAYDATVECWSRVLNTRDGETGGHSVRVTDMMVRLARRAGMNEQEVLYAKWGALLHDVGNLGIPDSILHKAGLLTDEEWSIVRRHPIVGYEMLSPMEFLGPALSIPLSHHERWDGNGYPHQLKGDEIPVMARLAAVIDVYDALRSTRPYRSAWPDAKVLEYLLNQAGTQFDPRAVELFLDMVAAEQSEVSVSPRRAA